MKTTHTDPDFSERLKLLRFLLWHHLPTTGFDELDVVAARLMARWRRAK